MDIITKIMPVTNLSELGRKIFLVGLSFVSMGFNILSCKADI